MTRAPPITTAAMLGINRAHSHIEGRARRIAREQDAGKARAQPADRVGGDRQGGNRQTENASGARAAADCVELAAFRAPILKQPAAVTKAT